MSERFGDKYAFLQFARATQSQQHDKARRWGEVLSGILSGDLNIGSRKPVMGMPAWVTPEVIRGGFSTGACAAGGKLLQHERKLADELGLKSVDISRIRTALNEWFLSDEGLARLHDWIAESRYDADTPEEMALICVALIAETSPNKAREILREIAPFFDRLRFYPKPLSHPRTKGLHVNSVQDVRLALQQVRPRKDILVQHASLTIWIPLYDQLIDLLSDHGHRDWPKAAAAWLQDYEAADKSHMAARWAKADGPFQRCRHVLKNRATGEPVSVRNERYAKIQIARHNAKSGQGSKREVYRQQQRRQNIDVWHDALAEVSLSRIVGFADRDGILETRLLLKPITPDEAKPGAPISAELPRAIKQKINSAKIGTIPELIEGGQISSPEILGAVLPKLTAELYARGFPDAASGFAFASIYQAFHRRRSLLLLDLESQVRLEELPWVKALSSRQAVSEGHVSLERGLLNELVQFTFIHFPHVQFPNPLIEQMQELGKRAGISTPFVSELAADIFMGKFSKNFDAAAAATVRHFADTLYARYYDLPKSIAPGTFAELCFHRAGPKPSQGRSVAYNGMVLEQAMILTSHNMGAAFDSLPLQEVDYNIAAIRCFGWICDRLQLQFPYHHAQLISLKKSAYAWRQMIAFLSRLDRSEQQRAWAEMKTIFDTQSPEFQTRMLPFIEGLEIAMAEDAIGSRQIRQFLGWSINRHPLLRDKNGLFE